MSAEHPALPPEGVLVLPDQLFEDHPCLKKDRPVFLVEEGRFFHDLQRKIRFQKKKLVLHRASMKEYEQRLRARGFDVRYVEEGDIGEGERFFRALADMGLRVLHMVESSDLSLRADLALWERTAGVAVKTVPSPAFLSLESWLRDFFRGTRHYSMARFYPAQRKRLGILVEQGRPRGGTWSFDKENRLSLSTGMAIPPLRVPRVRKSVKEAVGYVEARFPGHPGTASTFFYPVTHDDARAWLRDFLVHRLERFGPYEDSIGRDEPFLFHSVLTPCLNTGLLTPSGVMEEALAFADTNEGVPLNSLEGFVRQIIGWREFMRAVYLLEGERQRLSNHWGHERPLPDALYEGKTGIVPVDVVIRRVKDLAYAHHIERLMVLGNFMLLCEIHPVQVYRWFMEMFIDAFDWVMVPNVFGMSQYADGGLITTKPYISSSRYILAMSDYPKGPWCEVWDALFWRFIHLHREVFHENPRMRILTGQLDRMGRAVLERHLTRAAAFLDNLFAVPYHWADRDEESTP